MKFQSVRGMNDIGPDEIHIWHHIENMVRHTYQVFGYSEVRTPVVESTGLFKRGVGQDTDIVEKEMYTFEDRNGESLSLRPEGTASTVRAIVEHNWLRDNPVTKFYYLAPMFRHERPQKGRYRQFHQYGIELVGVAQPWADVEVIGAQHVLYENLNLKGVELRLSSVGCRECRPAYKAQLQALLESRKAEVPEDFHHRIASNPQRIFDHKDAKAQALCQSLPLMVDQLCSACREHFAQVRAGLDQIQVPYVLDPKIVRGLDYYNRTAFEFTSQHLGAQSAAGGGGRYDNLVEELGGRATPSVGYAGGMERLVMLLEADLKARQDLRAAPVLYLVAADEQGISKCMSLAHEARRAGVAAEVDLQGRSIKAQMKSADKLRARFSVIIGAREIQTGELVVKDMSNQKQALLPLSGWGGFLTEIRPPRVSQVLPLPTSLKWNSSSEVL